jgi:hypothetical protein
MMEGDNLQSGDSEDRINDGDKAVVGREHAEGGHVGTLDKALRRSRVFGFE